MKNKPEHKDTTKELNLQEDIMSGITPEKLIEMITQIYLPRILNELMLSERNFYLSHNPLDSANGFYPRTLFFKDLPLKLSVPRTRSSNFFPGVLPRYKRTLPQDYENLVESLLLSARSIEALKESIRNMQLPLSPGFIDELVSRLSQEFQDYVSREIDSDWLVVYIDAKEVEVKEDKKVKKMVLVTGVGVNMEGEKEVVGSKLFEGSENLERWREFLLDLRRRGMSRVLLIVTDNFPGVTKLVRGIFPMAWHQLCIVHLIRNGKYHLTREGYRRFREELRRVERASDFDSAYTIFMEIIEWLKGESPYFAERLRRAAENYVAFTRFPMEVRSRVKSTNASENLHKELERIRINTGGYFQSREVLYAKWQIYLRRLKERRWLKPEPKFKNVLGELHRLFWSVYEAEEGQEVN